MKKSDKENLISCYGTAHLITEYLEKMFDEKGQPKPDITKNQIDKLKVLTLENAATACAIGGTYDGHPSEPK